MLDQCINDSPAMSWFGADFSWFVVLEGIDKHEILKFLRIRIVIPNPLPSASYVVGAGWGCCNVMSWRVLQECSDHKLAYFAGFLHVNTVTIHPCITESGGGNQAEIDANCSFLFLCLQTFFIARSLSEGITEVNRHALIEKFFWRFAGAFSSEFRRLHNAFALFALLSWSFAELERWSWREIYFGVSSKPGSITHYQSSPNFWLCNLDFSSWRVYQSTVMQHSYVVGTLLYPHR